MADFIGSAGRLSFSVGQGSREMSENGCPGHADRSCSRSMAFRNDFRSMFSLSALERLWLSIETSGPRYAVAEPRETFPRPRPRVSRRGQFLLGRNRLSGCDPVCRTLPESFPGGFRCFGACGPFTFSASERGSESSFSPPDAASAPLWPTLPDRSRSAAAGFRPDP